MKGIWKGTIIYGLFLMTGLTPIMTKALSPEVKNLGPVVNSEAADFAPVISPDGKYLYFTSERDGGYGAQDVWVSERKNGEWTAPVNIGPPVNNELNQGPDTHAIINGKDFIFVTYCLPAKEGLCDIYVTRKLDDGYWKDPVPLGPAVNSEYSDANASWDYINRVLYFASTRPGGIPGDGPRKRPNEASYDIWRAKLMEDGSWTKPEHLGETVNTSGWEGVAFYHSAESALYFCSDGHGGMGGADIFKSRELEPGLWGPPEPVDELNTSGNDIYFSIPASGDLAYFSSSMSGGFGQEDLYVIPLTTILPANIIALRETVPVLSVSAGKHLATVYFEFDKAKIRESEKEKLNNVAELMNNQLGVKIEVAGHTDVVGPDDYNVLLSKERSDVVFKYLMNKKINPDRIKKTYFGETNPAAPVKPEEGNPLNRRVEVKISQY